MKKIVLLLVVALYALPTTAQDKPQDKKKVSFLKELYNDFLKYGTIYGAGDIRNSYEPARKEYYVRTNDNGNIYSIPVVVDGTEYNPFDYRVGFGIRKLARFDYERKPGNFWTGNSDRERQIAYTVPVFWTSLGPSASSGAEKEFLWVSRCHQSRGSDENTWL